MILKIKAFLWKANGGDPTRALGFNGGGVSACQGCDLEKSGDPVRTHRKL